MNNFQSILEISLFIIAMLIFALSIFAYLNKDPNNKKGDMHSLDLFWIFHEEYYNDYGKRVCRLARKITFGGIFLFLVWLVTKFVI